MNKITWIGEPSEPYDEKLKMWPQWTSWPYKIEGNDLIFIMDEVAHDVYLAEEGIKKLLLSFHLGYASESLVKAIEAYGKAREQKGRHEAEDSFDDGCGV